MAVVNRLILLFFAYLTVRLAVEAVRGFRRGLTRQFPRGVVVFHRLYAAEYLIGKVILILPAGPERDEFCRFVLSSWMGRLDQSDRLQHEARQPQEGK